MKENEFIEISDCLKVIKKVDRKKSQERIDVVYKAIEKDGKGAVERKALYDVVSRISHIIKHVKIQKLLGTSKLISKDDFSKIMKKIAKLKGNFLIKN